MFTMEAWKRDMKSEFTPNIELEQRLLNIFTPNNRLTIVDIILRLEESYANNLDHQKLPEAEDVRETIKRFIHLGGLHQYQDGRIGRASDDTVPQPGVAESVPLILAEQAQLSTLLFLLTHTSYDSTTASLVGYIKPEKMHALLLVGSTQNTDTEQNALIENIVHVASPDVICALIIKNFTQMGGFEDFSTDISIANFVTEATQDTLRHWVMALYPVRERSELKNKSNLDKAFQGLVRFIRPRR